MLRTVVESFTPTARSMSRSSSNRGVVSNISFDLTGSLPQVCFVCCDLYHLHCDSLCNSAKVPPRHGRYPMEGKRNSRREQQWRSRPSPESAALPSLAPPAPPASSLSLSASTPQLAPTMTPIHQVRKPPTAASKTMTTAQKNLRSTTPNLNPKTSPPPQSPKPESAILSNAPS